VGGGRSQTLINKTSSNRKTWTQYGLTQQNQKEK
jgi:hypothetical protein